MPDLVSFDELELRLLNALQISPRAPWTQLGEVLGVDPATAARRWADLAGSGRAWIAVYPGVDTLAETLVAFLEVDCEAGAASDVAEALVNDSRVSTIEHITGGHDLLLTIFVSDLATLSAYVLTGLGSISGVRGTRAHVATTVLAEGSKWRLRALDREQRRRLRAVLPQPSDTPVRPVDGRDTPLLAALAADGRTTYSDLAGRTGLSISTVRRRLTALLAHRQVIIRCEVAQSLSGWPVSASLWCRVPPSTLDSVARQLAELPETRLCSAVTGGPANLLLSTWMRSVGDMQRLEMTLDERVPRFEVINRALALRHVKRMGRTLDSNGRATGMIPLDIWAVPT
ncbi:MAG: Lrp/AsnC family transcriptional regulator [Pseudonocardiaceae bacterium]